MALVKHSVLMAKSYCIPIFKVSYNVPIINIVLRFIMFYYYCFYVQPLKIVCRKINKNEMKNDITLISTYLPLPSPLMYLP